MAEGEEHATGTLKHLGVGEQGLQSFSGVAHTELKLHLKLLIPFKKLLMLVLSLRENSSPVLGSSCV